MEPVTRTPADVIMVLGGGVGVDGEPSPSTVRRAHRTVALYGAGRARRIIMSGGYGMFDPRPRRSEAEAMAEIAVGEGCDPDDILIEAASRDTVGNIWFTKRLLQDHGWRDVIVVTSDWHVARVLFLAETIWGPEYRSVVEPIAVEDNGRLPMKSHYGRRDCWPCRGAGSPTSSQMTWRSPPCSPRSIPSTPSGRAPLWQSSRRW
jgi:uncharacterized SAM-binding protein YcdF (DUF218 family)